MKYIIEIAKTYKGDKAFCVKWRFHFLLTLQKTSSLGKANTLVNSGKFLFQDFLTMLNPLGRVVELFQGFQVLSNWCDKFWSGLNNISSFPIKTNTKVQC